MGKIQGTGKNRPLWPGDRNAKVTASTVNGRTNVRDAAPGNLSSPDRGFMSSDSSMSSPIHQRLSRGSQQQPPPAPHRTVGTIEDLLQASQYSVPDIAPGQLQVDFPDIQEELKNTPASPAMQDAVQAMLSMALPVNVSPPAPVRKASLLSKKARKDQPRSGESKEERAKKVYDFDEEDDDASVDPCYKDDQYVYPALQGSEDEAPVFKPRSKKPKETLKMLPKVLPSVPRPERAPREGVRKPEVESALADAAAKLGEKKPAKRKYTKRKLSDSLDDAPPSHPSSLLSKSHSAINHPLMKSKLEGDGLSESAPASVLAGKMAMESPKMKRPKKGMATAKQRLSKILKLNKGGRLII
ncbi:Lsd1/2 complex PHD finger containing protein Phf2 [Branchiostoma belcheri]|nr:Lsd1/2 complex PHD finger containing protein Phf2 [Branchiostoma belcheri]